MELQADSLVDALKVENTLLQEAIQRKDQELEEKVREIEFKDEEIKKKEQYISHLLAIPAPTPIVHEIFGTDGMSRVPDYKCQTPETDI